MRIRRQDAPAWQLLAPLLLTRAVAVDQAARVTSVEYGSAPNEDRRSPERRLPGLIRSG